MSSAFDLSSKIDLLNAMNMGNGKSGTSFYQTTIPFLYAERGEKKIVSLLKFAIAQNHQSMGKIYHLYTFQKSVSKVFGSVDSAKMIDEDVLLWIQWIAICFSSPRIC